MVFHCAYALCVIQAPCVVYFHFFRPQGVCHCHPVNDGVKMVKGKLCQGPQADFNKLMLGGEREDLHEGQASCTTSVCANSAAKGVFAVGFMSSLFAGMSAPHAS